MSSSEDELPRDHAHLRVLLVDDDADQRMLVTRLFHRAGITRVESAADGAAGIALAERHRPHLIVLDLAMPGRSGYDVLPDLQRAAPGSSIVILSNLPRRRLLSQMLERGAVGFVEKRTPPGRLVSELLVTAALTGLVREEVSIELVADRASSRAARRFVRDVLDGADGELLGDVELLVSELVTNAVLHASSAPRLEVGVTTEQVRVAVYDSEPTLPHPRTPDVEGPGGRGLHLVERLASRWGAEALDGGKVVWFEIDRSPAEA